jgi:hypothetical protein
MIRRNTNRRHMIDDHHGRNAWRANLLVRAVDGILGTHTHSDPRTYSRSAPQPTMPTSAIRLWPASCALGCGPGRVYDHVGCVGKSGRRKFRFARTCERRILMTSNGFQHLVRNGAGRCSA